MPVTDVQLHLLDALKEALRTDDLLHRVADKLAVSFLLLGFLDQLRHVLLLAPHSRHESGDALRVEAKSSSYVLVGLLLHDDAFYDPHPVVEREVANLPNSIASAGLRLVSSFKAEEILFGRLRGNSRLMIALHHS